MKQITFTYDGKEYKLEFTRRTIRQMEENGFNIQAINERMKKLARDQKIMPVMNCRALHAPRL